MSVAPLVRMTNSPPLAVGVMPVPPPKVVVMPLLFTRMPLTESVAPLARVRLLAPRLSVSSAAVVWAVILPESEISVAAVVLMPNDRPATAGGALKSVP